MDEQNERFKGPFSEKIVWPCKGGVDRQIKNEGGEEWTPFSEMVVWPCKGGVEGGVRTRRKEWTNKMKEGPAGQELRSRVEYRT